MSQNEESQNINSIQNNKSSQPKIQNKIISHKCSLSVDITYEKNKVVTKIFKKLKIILKRPQPDKNILRSASPRKKINKIFTYQKSHIKDKNAFYTNKSIKSAKNIIIINKGKKYDINPININLSTFEIIKDKNKNNINMNINNICSLLIKILNNNIYKSKQIFFNKIKYNNKVYHKKHINSDTNNNINNISLTVPNVLGYNKTKNFLEEINSDNSNTFIFNNKSITNDDSFEGNITIISRPDIKKLDDSNSNGELNNNINNIDNDENSIVNRNYSYDKKDMKDITSEQKNNIFKELKEELYNNSLNKKIILLNKKNKINKESLLFSEENILSANKSKSNIKEKEDNYKSTCKNIINNNNTNNSKINKTEFTSRNQNNTKRKYFIDSISFEKIEPNNLFESNKNNVENNKISYLNLNSNSINNTYSDKNNTNNNKSYTKNKNIKDCYENTCNSFEETTNVNEYENNPINKNTFDEEKYLFNNSSMKHGNFDIINSKELIINNKSSFNKEDNIIEKSGELEYYPINEIINNEEEYEIDIKGKNASFFKHKIVDKKNNIISFLSNEEGNNKINNKHPKLKAKISLNSYLNIIKKSLYKKKNINNEDEKSKEYIDINIKNKNKMSFSISSYEEFIKQLLDEIGINYYEKDNDYINNNDMLENDIDDFEDKIKNLKNSVLYLLVKKHYLNSMNDKLTLISENNDIIDERKKEIYNLLKKIKNNCNNNNINRVLDILKQYETISKRDIKITKYNYKKEKNEERDENLINYGSLILPFFYIAKFLSTFSV